MRANVCDDDGLLVGGGGTIDRDPDLRIAIVLFSLNPPIEHCQRTQTPDAGGYAYMQFCRKHFCD